MSSISKSSLDFNGNSHNNNSSLKATLKVSLNLTAEITLLLQEIEFKRNSNFEVLLNENPFEKQQLALKEFETISEIQQYNFSPRSFGNFLLFFL